MNQQPTIPATRNQAWGFWGTMNEHAEAAWPIAMTAIAKATQEPLDSVRAFLDSRHGRHFADEVQDHLHDGKGIEQAIKAVTWQWMIWTIGRQTSRDHGIPRGLPYLTGFVIHCAISEDAS